MTYSRLRKPQTTIGAGGLNCRVREGAGWTPAAQHTNQTFHIFLILVGRRCAHAEPTNTQEKFSQTCGLTVDTRQEFSRERRGLRNKGGGKALDH